MKCELVQEVNSLSTKRITHPYLTLWHRRTLHTCPGVKRLLCIGSVCDGLKAAGMPTVVPETMSDANE